MTTDTQSISANTRIYTDYGMISAKDLYSVGGAINVTVADEIAKKENSDIIQEASSVFSTGELSAVEIYTHEGYTITVSPHQSIYTTEGWVNAEDLTENTTVCLLDHEGIFGKYGTYSEGVLQGILTENYAPTFSNKNLKISLEGLSETADSEITQLYEWLSADSDYENSENLQLNELTMDQLTSAFEQSAINRTEVHESISDTIYQSKKEKIRGFLQVIFHLRGSIAECEEPRIDIYGDSYSYLREVQQILINFGINSTMYQFGESTGGRLQITGPNVLYFQESIGTFQNTQLAEELDGLVESNRKSLESATEDYTAKVSEITHRESSQKMFSLTEPTTGSYIANGFVVKDF